MVSKNCCCMTGGVVLGIIGAALIVVGLLAPTFVNHLINTGVKNTLTIASSDESKSSWSTFVTTNLNYTYYFFTMTPADEQAWYAGTAKPKLTAAGPFIFSEYTNKYNLTIDETNGFVDYNSWWNKTWAGSDTLDDFNAANLPPTTLVRVINTGYLGFITGAHALAKGPILDGYAAAGLTALIPALSGYNVGTPGYKAGPFVNPAWFVNPNASPVIPPSEQFFFNAAAGTYMGGLADLFLNPSSTFLTQFRFGAAYQYLNGSVASLEAHFSLSVIAGQWSNLTLLQQTFFNSNPSTYGGLYLFEICQTPNHCPTAITQAYAMLLLDPTSSVNLVTQAGFNAWTTQNAALLQAAFGLDTPAVTATVLAYLQTLTSATNLVYQGAIAGGLNALTFQNLGSNSRVANGAFNVSTWADIGALQYGCLLPLSGSSVSASPPLFSGPEYGAYLKQNGLYDLTNCMSVQQATLFLTASASSSVMLAGGLANITVPGGPSSLQPFYSNQTFIVDLLSYRSVSGFNLSVLNSSATGNLSPYEANYTFLGITDANKAAYISYVNSYVAPFAFYEAQFDATNFGLFTTRSVSDLLFGYSITLPQPESIPGLVTSYASQDQHYTLTKQGRYRIYSGAVSPSNQAGVANARLYVFYQGVSSVSREYDLTQPDNTGACTINCDRTTTASCVYNLDNTLCTPFLPISNNLQNVVITGASTTSTVGALYRENNPINSFAIFLVEAMRDVGFVLENPSNPSTVDYKGIHMYRYNIDTTQLLNSTILSANSKYYQTGPGGVIPSRWYTSGVPTYFSQPYFYNADPIVANNVELHYPDGTLATASSFNRDLIDTYVLVEPLSGYIMYGRKRLQVSVQLSSTFMNSVLRAGMFAHVPAGSDIYIPLVYEVETGNITDSDASDFRKAVYDNRHYADIAVIVGLAAGIPIVVMAIFCFVYYWRKPSTTTSAAPMERIPSREDLN